MEKYIDFFKSNFTIISLGFYVYGYIYLSIYFYQFDISIINYLTLQDILFTIINYLAVLLLLYLFVEIIYNIIALFALGFIFDSFIKKKIINRLGSSKRISRHIEYRNDKFYSKNRKGTTLILLLISLFIALHFTNETTLVFSLFLPFFILKLFQLIADEEKEKKELIKFFGVFIFLISILCFVYWGYKDGVSAKDSNSVKIVEFKENKITYNTATDSLNFIGETSKYLFVYHKNERKTLVFDKSNISSLKFTDTSLTKEDIEKQQIEIKNKIDNFLNTNKEE